MLFTLLVAHHHHHNKKSFQDSEYVQIISHCVRLPHYKFRGLGDPILLCCIGFVSIPYKNGNKQAAVYILP